MDDAEEQAAHDDGREGGQGERVLEEIRHTGTVAAHVGHAHQWREAHQYADRENEADDEDGRGERDRCQLHGAQPADHQRVDQLHERTAQL